MANQNENKDNVNNQNTEQNTAKSSVISDDLKKEAAESVGQVKDIIKNVNIKEEAENTKGFFIKMWKNPIKEMANIVDNDKEFFKIAVIILCIWTISAFLNECIYRFRNLGSLFKSFFDNIFDYTVNIITSTIEPICIVLVLSLIIYFVYRKNVKTLTQIIVIVTTAYFPRAIGSILSIIPRIISNTSTIISPINSFLYILSVVLVYNGLKTLFKEDDENFFKKYVVIQAIYILVRFILSYFRIYI